MTIRTHPTPPHISKTGDKNTHAPPSPQPQLTAKRNKRERKKNVDSTFFLAIRITRPLTKKSPRGTAQASQPDAKPHSINLAQRSISMHLTAHLPRASSPHTYVHAHTQPTKNNPPNKKTDQLIDSPPPRTITHTLITQIT